MLCMLSAASNDALHLIMVVQASGINAAQPLLGEQPPFESSRARPDALDPKLVGRCFLLVGSCTY